MKIGLAAVLRDPVDLLDWARRADAGPFARIGVNDRIVYDSPEIVVMAAAMLAVTTRIQVQTEVLLAPQREPVLLAKQAATLDRLSGGRFTLGLAVGARIDDFKAVGADHARRGRFLDEQLATMRRIWAGEPLSDDVGPIGPAPIHAGGPEILFGGFTPTALARVARWGDGFICSAMPDQAKPMFDVVEQSWQEAGRDGKPLLIGQVSTALGPQSIVDEARGAALEYYDFMGDYAKQLADGMLTTERDIRDTIARYEELGADEVVLGCWATDISQVDRLADLVGGL